MKPCNNNQRLRRSLLGMLLTAMILAGTLPSIADVETATRVYDPAGLSQTTVTAPDGNSYMKVEWAGLDLTETPGKPQLPVEYIRFLVPVYTKVKDVRVEINGISKPQKIYNKIIPCQIVDNYKDNLNFTSPSEESYNQDYIIRAEFNGDGFIDGCNHLITVAVYPVYYSPKSQIISWASNITVSLEYEACQLSEMSSIPLFPKFRSRHLDLKKMVVNKERVDNANFVVTNPHPENDNIPEYYFILTPRKFEKAFEDLAIWKRQKGYNVIIKCVEDIYNDPLYRIGATYSSKESEHIEMIVDSAMSVRCYLKDQFELREHYYCLLAGDWRTPVPIRKVCAPGYYGGDSLDSIPQPHDNGECLIPSDNYFADLSTDYKLEIARNTTIYSIVYSSDQSFFGTISLGRLLCASEAEIRNYTQKLIIYECNPGYGDNEYLNKVFAFEGCNRKWIEKNQEYVHSACLIGQTKSSRDVLKEKFDITLLQDHAHRDYWNLYLDDESISYESPTIQSGIQVISLMEQCGLAIWSAHGTPHGFQANATGYTVHSTESGIGQHPYNNPQIYHSPKGSGMTNLKNFNKPFFAYSASCSLSPFDVVVGGDNIPLTLPNFGRVLITEGLYGAVGAILNTRDSYIDYGTKMKVFSQAILDNPRSSNAILSVKVKDDVGLLNLIGDPEFKIWIGKPLNMGIDIIPNDVSVKIDGNLPYNASCSFFNGNSYSSSSPYNGNYFRIPYSGEGCFSIWETGYLPEIYFLAQNGSLMSKKKFIVRNAIIGNPSFEENKTYNYNVCNGGILAVYALDHISVNNGFFIKQGGAVQFDCDQTIELNGGIVEKGGSLIIRAKHVKICSEFKVEPGGILKIENK